MSNFPGGKVDGISQLGADEWNQTVGLNNLMQSTGQTPVTTDLNQISKASAQYGAGNFFSDSGTANAYVLSPIGSMQTPASYFDGMEVRFRPSSNSTTASTINVNSLGVKNIKLANGSTDITTQITTSADIILRFDSANDCFIYNGGIDLATTTAAGISRLRDPIGISNSGGSPLRDVFFSTGTFIFDDGSGDENMTARNKSLNSNWTPGSNVGGLDTGTVAADTTYHCFAIANPATGGAEGLLSASLTSPTLPSGYTKKRRVGSVITDGSANVIQFNRVGNYFNYNTPILDIDQSFTTTRNINQLTVPDGLEVLVSANLYRATERSFYICSPSAANLAPSTTTSPLFSIGNIVGASTDNEMGSSTFTVLTNTSRQIAIRASGASSDLRFATLGYADLNLYI